MCISKGELICGSTCCMPNGVPPGPIGAIDANRESAGADSFNALSQGRIACDASNNSRYSVQEALYQYSFRPFEVCIAVARRSLETMFAAG